MGLFGVLPVIHYTEWIIMYSNYIKKINIINIGILLKRVQAQYILNTHGLPNLTNPF